MNKKKKQAGKDVRGVKGVGSGLERNMHWHCGISIPATVG